MNRFKKIVPLLMVIISIAVLFGLYIFKDKIIELSSLSFQGQLSYTERTAEGAFIDSVYNYSLNGELFSYTFLEFGATGCSACRKMEAEMERVRIQYPAKVQVVFINVMQRPNQSLMKYFGIAAIPAQVLLDREGKVFFTHTGFISAEELSKQFN